LWLSSLKYLEGRKEGLLRKASESLPLTTTAILDLMAKNEIFQPNKPTNNVNGNKTKL
jgi:hypothetical protein